MRESDSQDRDRDVIEAAIRASLRKLDAAVEPPDAATIAAYVARRATDGEVAEVQQAMAESAAFRREMLLLVAEYGEAVERGRTLQPGEDTPVPPLDGLTGRAGSGSRPKRPRRSVWPVYVIIAAAALILLLSALVMISGEPMSFELVEASVDRAHLISNQTRGAEPARTGAYDSVREAAIAAFREHLKYENGVFVLRDTVAVKSADQRGATIAVSFVDDGGAEVSSVVLTPSSRAVGSATDVYVLTIPDVVSDPHGRAEKSDGFALYRLTVESDSVRAYWPDSWGSRVYVTACARDADSWHCDSARLLKRVR
jgi:hypothetical protein